MTDLLEIGTIGKPHGLRGEVLVTLSTNRSERLDPGSVLSTTDGPLTVVSARPHKKSWLVQFEEILDRTGAEAARGRTLLAEALDDLDDGYWVHDLVGATVREPDGTDRGRVAAVEANPASDLLVLDSGALVPVDFVTHVDDSGGIVIDAPDGLFDL